MCEGSTITTDVQAFTWTRQPVWSLDVQSPFNSFHGQCYGYIGGNGTASYGHNDLLIDFRPTLAVLVSNCELFFAAVKTLPVSSLLSCFAYAASQAIRQRLIWLEAVYLRVKADPFKAATYCGISVFLERQFLRSVI